MKFISRLSVLTLSASILAVSCGDFVSNIQVKGSPTFYAPLGSTSLEISEYLSIADIREMMGADSPDAELQVYEYPFATAASGATEGDIKPGTMRFLVHYPLTSIDLDFGQYLADLNFEDSIAADMPEQSFTVPDITDPDPQTVDFNAQLLAVLNAIPAVPAINVVIPVAGDADFPVEITLPGFDTASFSAGEMVLDFSSAPSNLTLTSVTLQNGTTIKASGTGLPVALSGATSVSIPLIGTTDLANEVRIVLGLNASAPTTGTLQFSLAFADSTRLDAATGVSLDPVSVEIPNVSIPAINDATFVQAVVGTGSIDLTIGPSSGTGVISGFTRELDLEIAQTGGLSTSLVNDTSANPSVPLAGEIINANSINLSGEITLSATNASFSGLGTTGLVFAVETDVAIDSFATVTLRPGAGFEFVTEVTQPISDDMKQWVSSVAFTEVGLDLTFTNGLPAGNNISLQIASNAFGINETNSIAPSNPPTGVEYSYTNGPYSFVPGNYEDIDFTFTVTPPGYVAATATEPATMTLANLSPGASFSFALDTAELVAEWTSIVIDPQEGFTGSYPEEGGEPLDMSSLTEYLGEGLGFVDIPMYFYLSGLDLTGTANIASTYLDADGAPQTVSHYNGTITDILPPLTINADADGLVTSVLPAPSASLTGFAGVLNASPSNLGFEYSIDVNAITLNKADLYEADGVTPKGATKLTADLVIVFPIAFEVASGGAELNIPGLNPEDGEPATDLFGREPSTDPEEDDINRALGNLESMVLSVAYNNRLGLNGTFLFTAPLADGSTFSKEITLDVGEGDEELTISRDDIQDIMDTVPFTPNFSITVNEDVALPRLAGLDATITVKVVTDINESFSLGGED